MDHRTGDRIEQNRVALLGSLDRMIATIGFIIDANRSLLAFPDHAVSAAQRISEAETELEELRAMKDRLQA